MSVKEYDAKSLDDQSVLGHGSYGTVLHCKHSKLGNVVVKYINITGSVESISEQMKEARNRIKIMASFMHTNIIKVYGMISISAKYGIIMEMASLGNLYDLLFRKHLLNASNISWLMKLKFFEDIACGLNYLHNGNPDKTFIHKDLKSENILISLGMVLKIADFGSFDMKVATGAITTTNISSNRQFTPQYAAPELLKQFLCVSGEQPESSSALDVYSYGMIGYEIVTCQKVFEHQSFNAGLIMILIAEQGQKPNPRPLQEIKASFIDDQSTDRKIFLNLESILKKCWNKDSFLRPKISEVLQDLFKLNKILSSFKDVVRDQARLLETTLHESNSSCAGQGNLLLPNRQSHLEQTKSLKKQLGVETSISPVHFKKGIKLSQKADAIYIVGGQYDLENAVPNVNCYAPNENLWYRMQNLPLPRARHGVCVVEGSLYVIGGWSKRSASGRDTLANCDKYDPISKKWIACSSMIVRREALGVGVIDNKIYAVGGTTASTATLSNDIGQKSMERYDTESDTWTMYCGMKQKKYASGCLVVNRKLYAVGGRHKDDFFRTVERYNPGDDKWSLVKPMHTARAAPGVAVFSHYLYAAGGRAFNYTVCSVEQYNLQDNMWTVMKSHMKHCKVAFSLCAFDGKIYAFGGFNGVNFFDVVECYDPTQDQWKIVSDLPIDLSNCASAVASLSLYPSS